RAESLDELRLDPQDPPRVRVHPVRAGVAVEQLLIRRPVRDLRPAQCDGALDAAVRPRVRTHAGVPAAGCRKARRARVAATTSAVGTCSSARCAYSGSPGPKL